MVVPTYLMKKHEKRFPKTHRIHQQITSQYQIIKEKVFSKFHRFNNERTSMVEETTLDFLIKYDFPLTQNKNKIQQFSSRIITSKLKSKKTTREESINWKRGRIKGKVISIIVKDGLIMQKVFQTDKGSIITVNRNELGIMPIIYAQVFKIFNIS